MIDINQYIGLAKAITRKFIRNTELLEDSQVYSEALLGLTIAAKTFNPDKNNKFSTWAYRLIYNQIISYLRTTKKLVVADVDVQTVQDSLPKNEDQNLEFLDDLDFILNADDRNTSMFIEHYLNGISAKELGRKHGISRQRVYEILEQTRVTLKNRLI